MQKKSKIPLITTVISVVIMLFLCAWQIKRYSYKIAIQQEIDNNANKDPELVSCRDLKPGSENNYKNLIIKDQITTSNNIFVFAGSIAIRGETGYFVVANGKCSGGGNVVINLGWIPSKQKSNYLNKSYTFNDLKVIQMPNEVKRVFTPNNDVRQNIWFYINSNELAEYYNIEDIGLYLQRDYVNNEYPVGIKSRYRVRNDHLGYALTWFLLSIVSVVVFVIYNKKSK